MKKTLLILCFLLFSFKAYTAPSPTMDISPAAVTGETIEADDENTRNNEVSTKYNAHTHTDFTETSSNTFQIGDGQTSNKNITVDNGDANLPALRFNDTSNIWQLSHNGSNFYAIADLGTTQTFTGTKTFTAITNLGTVTTADINGGTFGGFTIDGSWTAASQTCANLGTVTTADINAGTWQGTIDGNWTASGQTCADLGTVTTANIDGGTLDSVGIGSETATGMLYVNNSSDQADGLGSQGTSGQVLTSAGTGSNPTWTDSLLYFEPEGSCIFAYNNGELEFSPNGDVITLTSMTGANLVTGKVSTVCYDYDGTADYVTGTDVATHHGGTDYTIEAWVYRDTAGNSDYIISEINGELLCYMTDTNIVGLVDTSSGSENWDVAHGLSDNGINQWVYIVVAWNATAVTDVYVNGSDVGDGDGAENGTLKDTGGFRVGASLTPGDYFHGKIDGVRILKRKMAAAEVLSRYNSFK